MSFHSLQAVLGGMQKHYKSQEHGQLQQVMQRWTEIVGPIVAAQTKPLTIYRGVLKVATASAVWSQNLAFERQRILEKLNQVISPPLTDIRFSPGQWQDTQRVSFPGDQWQRELWQAHPSQCPEWMTQSPLSETIKSSRSPYSTPQVAFQHWAAYIKARSLQLPLCPECHSPTPKGELNRWQVCAVCAAKQWS